MWWLAATAALLAVGVVSIRFLTPDGISAEANAS